MTHWLKGDTPSSTQSLSATNMYDYGSHTHTDVNNTGGNILYPWNDVGIKEITKQHVQFNWPSLHIFKFLLDMSMSMYIENISKRKVTNDQVQPFWGVGGWACLRLC